MTKTIRLIVRTILAISLLLTGKLTHGQTSWDITGNAGTSAATNFIGTTDPVNLKIRTNNTIRMNITSSGKVGIGNFTPAFKFDVKGGSINTDSMYRINTFQVLTRSASNKIQIGDDNSFVGIGTPTPTALLDIFNILTADFNIKSSTKNAVLNIDRGTFVDSAVVNFRTGGSNMWQMGTVTNANSTDQNFVINNVSGGAGTYPPAIKITRSTNDVGIGNKLTVNNGADVIGVISSNGLIVNGTVKISGGIGGQVLTYNGGTGNAEWLAPTGGVSGTGSASRLAFWNGTSSLSFNSNLFCDGTKLGIGVSSPTAQLEVNGQVKITGGTPGAGQVLTCDANGLATWEPAPGAGTVGGSGLASRIAYWTGTSTVSNAISLAWDNVNGRMGIGATTPDTKLHILGGIDATPSSGTGYMVIGPITSTNVVYDDNEILARNNGVVSTLSLNANGGNVIINGSGTGMVGIGTNSPSFQLELSTNSAAKPTSSAWTVSSDARLKKDVTDFNDGLNIIKKINPVWFNYNGKAGMPVNERGVGTIAQELQKIAPYMIKEWTYENEKYLGVDYGAMDFILVNAIKEQQQQIEAKNDLIAKQQKDIDDLKTKFAVMENAISQCCTSYETTLSDRESQKGNAEKALLEQNVPNPFSEKTIIKFYVPQNTAKAFIKIYALDGSEVKSIPVSVKGFGETEISGSSLTTGTYTYMLMVDGKVADTKQMILTK
jgi:hypothetical protein